MNSFVRSNRRLAAFAVAALVAAPAIAALDPYITSQTSLSTFEYVIDTEHRYLYENVHHSEFGTGPLSYHYSATPQANSYNNSAYVDPATGKMRAFAFSDASVIHGSVGVEPPFAIAPSGDRSAAGASVSYRKQLEVTAGSSGLSAGDPVRLALTFHLDGRLAVGAPVEDPAPVYSAASMSSHFTIQDIAVPTEDDSIYELVHFSASAQRSLSVVGPGGTTYPEGAQLRSKTYQWSLTSNNPDEAARGDYDTDYREDPYNFGVGSGTTEPVPFVNDFNTGVLVVTFDTYVGAVLDIDAALAVGTTSNALAESPYASANFMNTFALEFTPAPGFEGVTILSNAVTPEPATLSLLALALPLAARRRSR